MFMSTSLQTRSQSPGQGDSGRVQVFHNLAYAQAFTHTHTHTHRHLHTHTHTHTHSAFPSPLGTGVCFSSSLSVLSISSVQEQPPSLETESARFSSLLLFFSFVHFLFLVLLLLRAEQFVCLGVRRVLHRLDFLFDLVGRVEAGAAQFAVDAFGVSVPVVAGHADHVSGLQGNVLAVARLVGVDGDLVVAVLTSKVVNVIQGVEAGGSVRMQRLHDLIGHAADLRNRAETWAVFS